MEYEEDYEEDYEVDFLEGRFEGGGAKFAGLFVVVAVLIGGSWAADRYTTPPPIVFPAPVVGALNTRSFPCQHPFGDIVCFGPNVSVSYLTIDGAKREVTGRR